jgi:hypothetical protein
MLSLYYLLMWHNTTLNLQALKLDFSYAPIKWVSLALLPASVTNCPRSGVKEPSCQACYAWLFRPSATLSQLLFRMEASSTLYLISVDWCRGSLMLKSVSPFSLSLPSSSPKNLLSGWASCKDHSHLECLWDLSLVLLFSLFSNTLERSFFTELLLHSSAWARAGCCLIDLTPQRRLKN